MKQRSDLYAGLLFFKYADRLRQEVKGLTDHHGDRDVVGIPGTEILSLLNGTLHVFAHTGKVGHELFSGRGERGAFAIPFKDPESHLIFQKFDLVGKGRLAHKGILCGAAEIKRPCQFYAVIDLFCCHRSTFRNKVI